MTIAYNKSSTEYTRIRDGSNQEGHKHLLEEDPGEEVSARSQVAATLSSSQEYHLFIRYGHQRHDEL